jgi:hypothetical protein
MANLCAKILLSFKQKITSAARLLLMQANADPERENPFSTACSVGLNLYDEPVD